mmetsp:Transcript_35616/g.79173  ORF Transcript_35616/g.79173 Transcript_35616/m.79173 type:complete len:216 (-) Transcript_35616:1090-1737(-)
MPAGTGPKSWIISRWQDHTRRMASGVPIPAPLGSPAGPNQWFWGAPVVRALMPQYVVPLTELPSTCCTKFMSLDTTAAVRWLAMRSRASSTRGSCEPPHSVTTWKGPNTSVVTAPKCSCFSICSRGTNTAVGSMAPYTEGIRWFWRGFPPNSSRAPGILSRRCVCCSIASVVQLMTGPMVRSSSLRVAASCFMRSSRPSCTQLLWANRMDCALHF